MTHPVSSSIPNTPRAGLRRALAAGLAGCALTAGLTAGASSASAGELAGVPSSLTSVQTVSPSPDNGAVITRRGATGRGKITVKNGTGSDALVTLASSDGRSVRSMYVRARRSATLSGVPDGVFAVYATFGAGWDATSRSMMSPRAAKFDKVATFTTRRTNGSVRTTQYDAGLAAVPGGNARLSSVPAATVPR